MPGSRDSFVAYLANAQRPPCLALLRPHPHHLFLQRAHADQQLAGVVLIGRFPDAFLVRTCNWRKHEALKQRIHSKRIPLSPRGVAIMKVVYVVTPVVVGMAAMEGVKWWCVHAWGVC